MSRINIKQVLEETVALDIKSTKTHIVNVVGTVELLKQGESLCLEAISVALSGMVKFEPKRFAAVVLRIKDSISTTACLVFRSAKFVIVGAKSKYHSLYAAQNYRQIIEPIEGVYRNGDHLGVFNLVGRTQFNKWGIRNIVAHSDLGCRPNLKILTELASEIMAWDPELFPGLKLLVWLKPKNLCKCVKKKKNKSCKCNSRVLLFDTGKTVYTGCKTLADVNRSADLVQTLLLDINLHEKEAIEQDRFNARRKKILDAAYIEFAGFRQTNRTVINTTNSSFDILMNQIKKHKSSKKKEGDDEEGEITDLFIKACKWKQIENVGLLATNEKVKNALESEIEFDSEIMKILEQYGVCR